MVVRFVSLHAQRPAAQELRQATMSGDRADAVFGVGLAGLQALLTKPRASQTTEDRQITAEELAGPTQGLPQRLGLGLPGVETDFRRRVEAASGAGSRASSPPATSRRSQPTEDEVGAVMTVTQSCMRRSRLATDLMSLQVERDGLFTSEASSTQRPRTAPPEDYSCELYDDDSMGVVYASDQGSQSLNSTLTRANSKAMHLSSKQGPIERAMQKGAILKESLRYDACMKRTQSSSSNFCDFGDEDGDDFGDEEDDSVDASLADEEGDSGSGFSEISEDNVDPIEDVWQKELCVAPPDENDEDEQVHTQALCVEALANTLLFKGVPPLILCGLAAMAEHVVVKPGEQLNLAGEERLVVVVKGELQARVGQKDPFSRTLGPQTVLNGVGFCCLRALCLKYRPGPDTGRQKTGGRQRNSVMTINSVGNKKTVLAYDVATGTIQSAPRSSGEKEAQPFRCKKGDRERNEAEDILYGLCPYGTVAQEKYEFACPDLQVIGARAAVRRSLTTGLGFNPQGRASFVTGPGELGGAVVAMIPSLATLTALSRSPVAMRKAGVDGLEKAIELIERHITEQTSVWTVLMPTLGAFVLPGVPAEIVWELASKAELFTADAGCTVVQEGSIVDNALIVLVDGVATVERKSHPLREGGEPVQETVGRLHGGAIIGDFGTLSLGFSHPATVRAKTTMRYVRISVTNLMTTIFNFPGSLGTSITWLALSAGALQAILPTKTEVVRSLSLFRDFSTSFLSEMAALGERRIAIFDTILIAQGSAGGTLSVIEHGHCCVDVNGQKVADILGGHCFGERTILGSAEANATIRVSSAYALLLQIRKDMLDAVVEKLPADKERLEAIRAAPSLGRAKGSKLRNVELFRFCSFGFLELLGASCATRIYLPGQSIVVEGDEEEDIRMFVLVGGQLSVLINGQKIGSVAHGSTFGERAFLGQARCRAVTVRASELSTLLEIPQSAFSVALERFPPDEEMFRMGLGQGVWNSKVSWPFLRNAETRFAFLMDLNAESIVVHQNEGKLQQPNYASAAILVISGSVSVVNDQGLELRVLNSGDVFNEQILLKAPPREGEHLLPKSSNCDVKVLTESAISKVLFEFPDEREPLLNSILACIAEKWEKELVGEANGSKLLRRSSALFHEAPEECVLAARRKLKPMIFNAGDRIGGADKEDEQGQDMFFLLDGTASYMNMEFETPVCPGTSFGEPVLLGVARKYPGVLTANTTCIALALSPSTLSSSMSSFPEVLSQVERLRRECLWVESDKIRRYLLRAPSFGERTKEILDILCPRANIEIFHPGQIIMDSGERCELGKTNFYVVLGGVVEAEGSMGTILASLKAGAAFGEMGAFGLTETRTAATRASRAGLCACAVIRGSHIKRAVESKPDAFAGMVQYFEQQAAANKETVTKRKLWLSDVAVPGLEQTHLFSGCSATFLHKVAVTLNETLYGPNEVLAVSGADSTSMFVLLSGKVELLSHSGERVGVRRPGATVGEIACLGMFPQWMATVRTMTDCSILTVTSQALDNALEHEDGDLLREGLRKLKAERRMQVELGTPLCLLEHVVVDPTEAGAQIIALLSERRSLTAGQKVEPAGEHGPCGSYYSFLRCGRLVVEVEGEDVLTVVAGSIVEEGVLVEFGARLRADGPCELYRVSKSDFKLAVACDSKSSNWSCQFRLKEKEMLRKLRMRLTNARGLRTVGAPRVEDQEIQQWAAKRLVKADQAAKLREARAGYQFAMVAPHAPPPGFGPVTVRGCSGSLASGGFSTGSDSDRGLGSAPARLPKQGSGKARMPSHFEANRGLSCYPVVKLPQIQHMRRRHISLSTSRSLSTSVSEPMLRGTQRGRRPLILM